MDRKLLHIEVSSLKAVFQLENPGAAKALVDSRSNFPLN